jgi:hypothetical protein
MSRKTLLIIYWLQWADDAGFYATFQTVQNGYDMPDLQIVIGKVCFERSRVWRNIFEGSSK